MGVLMQRTEQAATLLNVVRDRGVQVSSDDFGTGYSSLSYLTKFPLDALKIDQSFVHRVTATPNKAAIVSAIISMGRSLGLRVIAEGVETAEDLEFLKAHDCDKAQGFYFSPAIPPEEFAKILRANAS
jgi:diguanylate cyclase